MEHTLSTYNDVQSPTRTFGQGQIQLILGPMFSGKTTELMRRLRRYQVSNHRCFVVKYAKDNRYTREESVCSHDQQTMSAVAVTTLSPLLEVSDKFSVIGVDEAQFFPDCVNFAETLANNGKIVVLSALDGTFQRQPFGDILQLVPRSESVIKLNAVCMKCYRSGSFTKRIGSETELEVIGGADKYMSVCRRCYFDDLQTDKIKRCLNFPDQSD